MGKNCEKIVENGEKMRKDVEKIRKMGKNVVVKNTERCGNGYGQKTEKKVVLTIKKLRHYTEMGQK